MLNVYLPTPIYERLPALYMILACALALAPLAPIKWLAILALIVATAVVRHQRREYRSDLQVQASRALMDKYRKQTSSNQGNTSSSDEVHVEVL